MTVEEKKLKSREAARRYRVRHPDRIKEQRKRARGRDREYRERNKERLREYFRQYYLDNQDKKKAQQVTWRSQNKERMAATKRLYLSTPEGRAKHREAQAGVNHRRRVRQLGGECEKFSREEIYERDQGICYLCGLFVKENAWHLDHIIPVALGGGHTRRNVAVSCPSCNRRKGTKLVEGNRATRVAAIAMG